MKLLNNKEVIARYYHMGKKFEVVVHAEKAWQFKTGKLDNVREVLVGDIIYYDVRKALKASMEDVKKVFGTDNVYEVAARIIKEGELQLTAEQRRELIEEKRRRIIEVLSRNAIDPRTGLPHPPLRIEMAIKESKAPIDPFKPVEEQVKIVIDRIKGILPLKLARARVAVKVPPAYVGRAYGPLSKMGRIIRVHYLSDGSMSMELEIAAGLTEALLNRLLELTKGEGEMKILSKEFI